MLDVPGQMASFSRGSIVFGSCRIKKVPAELLTKKRGKGGRNVVCE